MEQMIEVAGGRVWADDTGGPGAPVVLLHPGIGDSRVWNPIVPRLAARYRVIRYDARGHGASPPATAPYTLLDDLIAVLDYLQVAQATLAGCSQGGASSIDLALAQPERVSALVLVSPGVSGYPMPDEPELDAEFDALADAGDVEGIAMLSPRQLELFGFPPPGHPFWTAETLSGMALRYPGIDLSAWSVSPSSDNR